ncbi:fungal-specific transcription factor domain-containing protein [Aspergillus bertholletiae]|uniref:Fungal-specific transcription factor domain-containing protein n=1 Tax=Aspergillus bertholletiae TaxID=1226010 RepID=A0A5N7B0U0_9EURO|nr:fungal-specific transcription factor domain-containing protein [Aspergillus bertholletiae]
MSSDMRQASGSSKAKRRLIDADDENRPNPAADEHASNPKRQRVSRACDSCRSKKDKCDGVQPVCSTCASLSRPCTYKANPKKRGLPTGYIRTLELLWGLVFCKIRGSEDVVRALLKAANMPSHLSTMGKEAEGSDTLLFSWKNSAVLRDVERMLTLLEQPEDEQEKELRVRGDSDSPQDASSMLSSDTLEWYMPEGLGDGRESSLAAGPSPVKTPTVGSTTKGHLTRNTRDSGTQTSPPDDAEDDARILVTHPPSLSHFIHHSSESTTKYLPRLPSNAWALIDIYFTYTQCWFPILEKHDILRTAFRHSEDNIAVSAISAGSGNHAALWAVLALASIQEASITATRQLPQAYSDRPNPTQLYATAKSLIPGEEGAYDIGHVQALLILSLIKLGQQDWAAAWVLVGQAVRISQCLRLDRPLGTQPINGDGLKSSGRAKHVFLGCFVLETIVAMQADQIPSLRKGDLMKIGPINEDGLEEWHPWEDQTGLRPIESSRGNFHRGPLHALSTFNRLVSLICILNDLCCFKQSMTGSFAQLEVLERQLQIWISALPKSYRVDVQANSAKPASPHIFGLEMMYEGVVATLSLQFAIQKSDANIQEVMYKERATESSKRLLLLLQMFMETYSLSATFPSFGTVLSLSAPPEIETHNLPLLFDLDPGLKQKLRSFASHLATVWHVQEKNTSGARMTTMTPSVASMSITQRQRSLTNPVSADQNSFHISEMPIPGNTTRRSTHLDISATDPLLSNSWMRTASNAEDNAALSLPTPASSVNINRGVTETLQQASQPREPAAHRQHASISSSTRPVNGAAPLPDLNSFQPLQYQTPYSEPNNNIGSFLDIDGYGSLQRPRIAPDLDALFDELASLDGTEKADNQPEFMQNLGFVPDAGIPELYSYSSQVEPFLLAQTQQLPIADPSGVSTGVSTGN